MFGGSEDELDEKTSYLGEKKPGKIGYEILFLDRK